MKQPRIKRVLTGADAYFDYIERQKDLTKRLQQITQEEAQFSVSGGEVITVMMPCFDDTKEVHLPNLGLFY